MLLQMEKVWEPHQEELAEMLEARADGLEGLVESKVPEAKRLARKALKATPQLHRRWRFNYLGSRKTYRHTAPQWVKDADENAARAEVLEADGGYDRRVSTLQAAVTVIKDSEEVLELCHKEKAKLKTNVIQLQRGPTVRCQTVPAPSVLYHGEVTNLLSVG